MRSTLVVKREVPLEPLAGFGYRVVSVQVHFLILDALPKPFDKDVIAPGTFAVHADLDTVPLHLVDKGGAGELAALVRIQDLRGPVVPNRGLKGLQAEVRRHAVG